MILVNIFFDATFKIVPAKFRPYKLFVIIGLPKKENKPKVFTMILTKYLDQISYSKIFTYLFENHNFNPKILHSDYENAIAVAIKNTKVFNENLIHSIFFFHFSNMIKKIYLKQGYLIKY